jgi:hypothetical protein
VPLHVSVLEVVRDGRAVDPERLGELVEGRAGPVGDDQLVDIGGGQTSLDGV